MSDFVVVAALGSSAAVLDSCQTISSTLDDKKREFSCLIDRRDFFSDVLRSFPVVVAQTPPIPVVEATTSDNDGDDSSSFVLVEREPDDKGCQEGKTPSPSRVQILSSHWDKIWRQFQTDIHRQNYLVCGERFVDATEALKATDAFVQRLLELQALRRLARATQEGQCRILRPWRWIEWAPTQPSLQEGSETSDVARFHITREVIMLSQQSVLAFPFEAIHRQLEATALACNAERPWFLGELRGERTAGTSGMVVELTLDPAEDCPLDSEPKKFLPTMRVTKSLRVFDVHDDGTDHTVQIVDATLSIALLGDADDPVVLTWCTSPVSVLQQLGVACPCLGASSGFHRQDCHLRLS